MCVCDVGLRLNSGDVQPEQVQEADEWMSEVC